jgi:decaprenylphospho-beta-D-ribofuranose 2-oxidase
MFIKKKLSGWSSYMKYETRVFNPKNKKDLIKFLKSNNNNSKIISRGNGCSFGDQAICSVKNGVTIDLSSLNTIIKLDKKNNHLIVEGGVKLNQILRFLLPKNLTLNSIPGGLEITVGGAISNNVHGKDCWKNGYFENNVKSILISDAYGKIKRLSRIENKRHFESIFSSIGLIGIILEVELYVKKIPSQLLMVNTIKVKNLKEMERCFETLENKNEFAVAWLDCFAKGKNSMRGIFQKASYIKNLKATNITINSKFFENPENMKIFGILPIKKFWQFIKIFFNTKIFKIINPVVFNISSFFKKEKIISYVEFLMFETKYLPSYKTWFEPDGFLCIQPYFTKKNAFKKIKVAIQLCQHYGVIPFWCPIKKYKPKDGLFLDFADKEGGYSIVIDFFPKEHNKELVSEFILKLEKLILKQRGKLYLSKDNVMSKEFFKKTYPNFKKFLKIKKKFDPDDKFISNQYIRLLH